MLIQLCDISIQLETDLPAIHNDWQDIFALHQHPLPTAQAPQVKIRAGSIEEAPPTDLEQPITRFKSPNGTYTIAFTPEGRSKLILASGAILCLPDINKPYDTSRLINAELFISKELADLGQVEDATFTLLAPIMRRFGIYIIHAFGAVHPTKPEAALIIGQSGQGKTTTGLSLIIEGWHYLGNDAIFLSKDNQGQIVAWPSPGRINLHPKSLDVLNNHTFLPPTASIGLDQKFHFSAKSFESANPIPAPIHFLLFPEITNQTGDCQFQPLPAAIALSQTLEQSIDHWDKHLVEEHLTFLGQLTSQTKNFQTKNTLDLTTFNQALLTHSTS